MRVRFEWLATVPLELPVSYHQILQGIVYRNLRNEYRYSEFVHETGYHYGQRQFRMFCFSHIAGKCHFKNGKLIFSEELSFEVSSPDVYLIRTLAKNVSENGLNFGSQHCQEVKVCLSDIEIEAEEMLVRAISPITVYSTLDKGKTRYYAPSELEFAMAMGDNFQRKYMAYYGVSTEDSIQIEPVNVTESDKCVTKYKGIYITGYSGIYRIMGKRKYLNFLYQTGVGSKNAQGFGMIELAE